MCCRVRIALALRHFDIEWPRLCATDASTHYRGVLEGKRLTITAEADSLDVADQEHVTLVFVARVNEVFTIRRPGIR
jgi:hypothetical protein